MCSSIVFLLDFSLRQEKSRDRKGKNITPKTNQSMFSRFSKEFDYFR
jgi:hypothetical protein